ncbi:MAG: TonB-dependent receptor [Thiobacillus sp.]|nr:TonB-dependent receptor [Thiobacillus sp.]
MYRPAILAAALAAAFPAHADTELDALRAELKEMKTTYEARIQALEARLQQAEAKTDRAVAQAGPPRTEPTRSNSFNPDISLILQGQYAHLDDRAHRHISGFLDSSGGHEHGATPRGFSLDHTELVISSNIDPDFRGYATFAIEDESIGVEEAWFQTTSLGRGLSLKGGRYRSGIGYANQQHPHAWDFVDNALITRGLFGEALSLDGVQARWLAPTPVFLEFGAEAGRGLGAYNANGVGSYTVYAHVGDDLGASHSWRAGLSAGRLRTADRDNDAGQIGGGHAETAFSGRTRFAGADFVWKWAPDGNPTQRNLKIQGEYYKRWEKGDFGCFDPDPATPGDACDGDPAGSLDTAQSGWYLQGVYQFMPRWRAGYRYDRISLGRIDYGALNASLVRPFGFTPQRNSVMVDYSPSEFSRIRLQVSRDESSRLGPENQYFLQYIMSLGSHGAHAY